MLPEFPGEIFNLILDEVPSRKDLKNLCEVSRAYYQATIPKLYETVVIKRSPNANSIATELVTRHRSSHCFQFVKTFKCNLRYEFETRSRCIHQTSGLYDGPYDWEPFIDPFPDFNIPILSLLGQLKDHQLESFSWGLGTCLPSELFGADGYLARKQNCIRSLSLVTNASYFWFNVDALDFTAFKNLRNFSWKNIGSDNQLDFGVTVDDMSFDRIRSDFLYDEALDNKIGNNNPSFPSLKTLALSEVRFQRRLTEVARFFNLSGLRTLRLHKCLKTDSLLQQVAESNVPLKLTTFELVPPSYGVPPSAESINLFLKSFRGLEHLYISLDCFIQKHPACLHAIAKHSLTLKELVFEQSALELFSICDKSFFCAESGFLGALYDSVEPLLSSILTDGVLECLGLQHSFILLKPLLKPTMGKSLRVLHLRKREVHFGKGSRDEFMQQKEELYEEMTHNNQLFNPELETDNDSDNLQPDQLHRPIKDLKTTLKQVYDDFYIQNKNNRDKCTTEWENYKFLLLEFAQWAFGPNGFRNLQYIVYRDFPEEAYAEPSIVLRKNTQPPPTAPQQQPDLTELESGSGRKHQPRFRLLENSDRELGDLRRDYSDFFSSVPFQAPQVVAMGNVFRG